MEKAVKTAYVLFLIAFISYLLKYGLNVFLAVHLSADRYGELCVAIKLLQILVVVTLFGTNLASKRFLPMLLHSNNKMNAENYIAWNLKLLSFSFLICLSIALAAIGIMFLLHFLGVKDINEYHMTVYMLWIVPVASIAILLSNYQLSSGQIFFPTVLNEVLKYFIQLCLFGVVFVLFGSKAVHSLLIVGVLLLSYLLLSIITIPFMNADLI